jgi:hypothetical protein
MHLRKTMKLLHTVASAGLIGGLMAYGVLLVYAPQDTLSRYADMRQSIMYVSNYVLLPSLGIALVTGLLSMAVHPPFQEKRWAWIKALLGIGMFEATLGIIGSKADYAAKISAKIASGETDAALLKNALATEWSSLFAIMALSIANVVLGVWRPALTARRAAP